MLPRILMINTQSIYKNNATGITMRSIVSVFPEDHIMELYRYDTKNKIAQRFNFKSIQLPPKAMPFNYCIRKFFHLENYTDAEKQNGAAYGSKVKHSLKEIIRNTIKALLENSLILPDKRLLKMIDAFKPQVIYTMGASFYIHKWTLLLSKRYQCPIILHYMDNWRQTAYTEDSRMLWLNKKLNRQVSRLEDRMENGLTISDEMAEVYQKLYRHHYYPLMNVVESMDICQTEHKNINIVYAGGLHLGRELLLAETEKAIIEINKCGCNFRLLIYTSEDNRKKNCCLFHNEVTTFCPALPHERIGEAYEQADILLHIESFDPQVIQFTKYSLSTKIPEYFASGKPLLCYAPETIASYRYIMESGAGYCVTTQEGLLHALQTLQSPEVRYKMGELGKKIAKNNHSRQKLEEIVLKVFEIPEEQD